MKSSSTSILEKNIDPVLQASAVYVAALFLTLLGKFVELIGLIDVTERFPWLCSASFMLLFAIFNSILSLSSKDMNKYWGRSMMCFMGLAVISGLTAYLISGININDAGSYRWIYIVVTVGYLVFMSIMGFMKRIVEFAEKEEWNSPKQRSKKRR